VRLHQSFWDKTSTESSKVGRYVGDGIVNWGTVGCLQEIKKGDQDYKGDFYNDKFANKNVPQGIFRGSSHRGVPMQQPRYGKYP
jgi:hypothetical protein